MAFPPVIEVGYLYLHTENFAQLTDQQTKSPSRTVTCICCDTLRRMAWDGQTLV